MEHSLSWEANNHSTSQEISRLLCDPKVHYRAHKSPSLAPVLNQMHAVHSFSPIFLYLFIYLFTMPRLRQFWGPPSLLSNSYRDLFPRG